MAEAAVKLRVAHFKVCDDPQCPFSSDLHLLISTDHVDLARGNAVALSYTWGDFDRLPRRIGHRADQTPVDLELGAEWTLEDVMTKLDWLCREHQFCWMDQLCIPQDDEAVRAALASIPLIYQTLDVIALLPGSLCACAGEFCFFLNDTLEAMAAEGLSKVRYEKKMENLEHMLNSEMDGCLNSCGMCSWFSRLWTRQELLYAQRIRVAWASDRVAPCVKNPIETQFLVKQMDAALQRAVLSDKTPAEYMAEYEASTKSVDLDDEAVANLSPYAARFYKERLAASGSPEAALADLYREHQQYTERGVSSFSEFLDVDRYDSTSEQLAFITFVRFLNGQLVEKDESYGSEMDVEKRLRGFFAQVGRLGSLQRAATQPRDYVVAVWVDCPGYVLPANFKTLGLSALLDDALQQIERKHGLSFVVSAPAGLFGSSERGALWQPSQYLDEVEIDTARDVYGVLPRAKCRPIKLNEDGLVALQHIGAGALARSRVASEYRALFSGRGSTKSANDTMKAIIARWPGDVTERISYSVKSVFTKEQNGEARFRDCLFNHTVTTKDDANVPENVKLVRANWPTFAAREDISEADHYEATYGFVATALGLDKAFCQRSGLHLVVGMFPAPHIGLSSIDPGKIMEVDIDAFHDDDEVWTICMSRGSAASGSCLLEVRRVPGDDAVPRYRVTGVWVPCRGVLLSEVAAVPSMYGRDGVIVG